MARSVLPSAVVPAPKLYVPLTELLFIPAPPARAVCVIAVENEPTVRGVATVSMRKSAGKTVIAESFIGVPSENGCVYGTVVDNEIAARTAWAEKIAIDERAAATSHVFLSGNLEVLRPPF